MVTAPVLVLLYDRTFEARSFGQALTKNWPLYASLLLSWLVILALNVGGPRAETAGFHLGINPLTWWFTQAKVLALYCKLVVWPWPLIIHYHIPYVQSYWEALPWVAAAGALGLFVLDRLWQGKAVGYLGAWAFIILSPTLVVPIITEVAAERRMYLPLAAIVTLGVTLLYELVTRVQGAQKPSSAAATPSAPEFAANAAPGTLQPAPRPASSPSPLAITVGAAACVAVVLAGVGRARMLAYQDGVTLFADAVAHQPDDPVCTYTLGLYLIQAGRQKEAVPHLRRTMELRREPPPEIDKYLGIALTAEGSYDEAIERLQRAVSEKPNDVVARRTLGIALLNSGTHAEAISQLEQVAQAIPDSVEDIDRLAAALLNANRAEEAVDRLQHALQLEPGFFPARFKLAIAYANLKRREQAIAAGEQALAQARQDGANDIAEQISAWLSDYLRNSAGPKNAP
jgi:tetratricopeptide (TPR) repeat protein